MGAFAGGMTVKRFRVKDEGFLPSPPQAVVALKAHAAVAVPPDGDEERRVGWVVCDRLLDTAFTTDNVFYNDFLVVTLRVETRKPPAAIVKARLQERTAAVLAERGKDNLSRQERNELLATVVRELRRQMLPAYKGVDLVWNLSNARVWVFTHSPTVTDEVVELFLRTFGQLLIPEDPYSAAERLALVHALVDGKLDTLMPATFAAVEA